MEINSVCGSCKYVDCHSSVIMFDKSITIFMIGCVCTG